MVKAAWARRWLEGDAGARVGAAGVLTAAGLLCGVALSWRLWFPAGRSFPRAPLVDVLPAGAVAPFELLAGVVLVMAAAALLFARRAEGFAAPAVVLLLVLFALSDQTRLQPWVYQYSLLLAVVVLCGRRGAGAAGAGLAAMRLIVAALYFWGGAQKLNYSFGAEVLPQLLGPLRVGGWPAEGQWAALGAVVALAEMFTGGGLLDARTRRLCVVLAVALHAAVLALLVAGARNSVVWPWNVALSLLVIILFRRGGAEAPRATAWGARGRAALTLAAAAALLPALSFRGWWDAYLSGALYSGNTPLAVVRVDAVTEGRLPGVARRQVFETRGGERVLPVFEWASDDLNVPPYPEPRVFERIAREVCALTGGGAELIMRGRPAVLDGRYQVFRADCSRLGARP